MKYMIEDKMPKVVNGLLLSEAQQDMVRELEKGTVVECPCCGRQGRIYQRHFGPAALRALRVFEKVGVEESGKKLRNICGDYAFLRFWGLVEKCGVSRWVLTLKGEEFLFGEISIPRTIVMFFGEVLSLKGSEIYVSDVGEST